MKCKVKDGIGQKKIKKYEENGWLWETETEKEENETRGQNLISYEIESKSRKLPQSKCKTTISYNSLSKSLVQVRCVSLMMIQIR